MAFLSVFVRQAIEFESETFVIVSQVHRHSLQLKLEDVFENETVQIKVPGD